MKCFIYIASSAPVERLFSIARKVFRPERCRLADTTVFKLMFIISNNKYFNIHSVSVPEARKYILGQKVLVFVL